MNSVKNVSYTVLSLLLNWIIPTVLSIIICVGILIYTVSVYLDIKPSVKQYPNINKCEITDSYGSPVNNQYIVKCQS